jgi:hypothetical protein
VGDADGDSSPAMRTARPLSGDRKMIAIAAKTIKNMVNIV